MGIWVSNLVFIPKTTLILVFTLDAKNKKIISSVCGGHITFNKFFASTKDDTYNIS
jgi:hypothetical protein